MLTLALFCCCCLLCNSNLVFALAKEMINCLQRMVRRCLSPLFFISCFLLHLCFFCATKIMAQLPQKFLRVNKPYLNYIFSLTGRVKLNNFIVLSIVGIFLHWCYGKLEENYYWLSNFFLNYFVLLSFATITKKLVHSQYKICWALRPSIL